MAYLPFDKLKAELAAKPGVTSPGGLAATIGRKDFGAKTFNHAAATGTSLKGKHKKGKHHAAIAQMVRGQ